MANRTKLTPKRKKAFLAALAYNANVTEACELVGVSTTCAYQHKAEDSQFGDDWNTALKAAVDRLESVAWERATEGVAKPVYQQGQMVGHIQQYSDTLLIFLMKGHNPDRYKDRAQVEHMGKVEIDDAKRKLGQMFDS